ncbi:DUF2510 domain-containing protein [Nonomuraea sp. NPDC048892]|uniref:DUF2510 domain-containing protein n=1 Tax=Nonomuraea sp. NPDC048892 TaxID=3154624 RepID=UPI0033D7C4F6
MTTQTPAGWYPDPYGEPQLRWWDGSQWTDALHAQEPPGRQPASGPQPQPSSQPSAQAPTQAFPQPQPQSQPSSQPQPQPQTGPGWAATPANPTLQFGHPTYGQSAYGAPGGPAQPSMQPPTQPPPMQPSMQPPTQQQWGGPLPGPGYPPPPKQGNPLPWVFGGLAALVVLALIVVAGIFFINRDSTLVASPPSETAEPRFPTEDPPSQDPPSQDPLPSQGAEFPQPVDGVITDPRSGLAFKVPSGWQVAAVNEVNSGSPAEQQWTAAVKQDAQENYDREADWIGNVFTGVLNELYPYSGVSGLGDTAKAVFVDFTTHYYAPAHESKIVADKAMKVGDKDAWLLQFELDFTKISEEKGFKWKKENGAIVLVDRGDGQRPAIAYVSVPDNLGTDVVEQVLGSLKPA